MSGKRAVPSALEPYLQLPPEASLVLLTSTLGCTEYWLTSRFVSSLFNALEESDPSNEPQMIFVLASWLQDPSFWKSEIKRTTNIDISKYPQNFHLINLFSPPPSSLQETQSLLSQAISQTKQKPILILDHPDTLIATSREPTSAHFLNNLILQLRSQVHATVLTCNADLPLVQAATSDNGHNTTPLEAENAAFVTSQAHAARLVMSLRPLDTGAAKDVSGVLRITRGGSCYSLHEDGGGNGDGLEESELLYLVQRDGNVKVFHRGSDAPST